MNENSPRVDYLRVQDDEFVDTVTFHAMEPSTGLLGSIKIEDRFKVSGLSGSQWRTSAMIMFHTGRTPWKDHAHTLKDAAIYTSRMSFSFQHKYGPAACYRTFRTSDC